MTIDSLHFFTENGLQWRAPFFELFLFEDSNQFLQWNNGKKNLCFLPKDRTCSFRRYDGVLSNVEQQRPVSLEIGFVRWEGSWVFFLSVKRNRIKLHSMVIEILENVIPSWCQHWSKLYQFLRWNSKKEKKREEVDWLVCCRVQSAKGVENKTCWLTTPCHMIIDGLRVNLHSRHSSICWLIHRYTRRLGLPPLWICPRVSYPWTLAF